MGSFVEGNSLYLLLRILFGFRITQHPAHSKQMCYLIIVHFMRAYFGKEKKNLFQLALIQKTSKIPLHSLLGLELWLIKKSGLTGSLLFICLAHLPDSSYILEVRPGSSGNSGAPLRRMSSISPSPGHRDSPQHIMRVEASFAFSLRNCFRK
jgi:hypothetical protein